MRLMILTVAILAACIGWSDARCQDCAGVTATQEDGSVVCFPPVNEYIDSTYDVTHSGTGLAIGTTHNEVLDTTDAICVGCAAVVVTAQGRTNFNMLVVETHEYGMSDRVYYRPSLPGRYDAETNSSSASYVMRYQTTVSIVRVGADAPVTVQPYFAHVE